LLGRRTGLVIANTVAGAFLGFVALKVFAVATGEDADGLLGQLAFAMGIAGLLSILVDLGMGSAHVKRVSEGRRLADATATFALVKVGLAALFVLLVAGAAFAADALGFLADTNRFAIVIIAVHFAFMGLRTIFTATFDGRQEFAKTQLVVLAEHLVRVPATILFAFAYAGAVHGQGPLTGAMQGSLSWAGDFLRGHAVEGFALTYALAALASFLAGWLLFRRGYPVGRFDRGIVDDYWEFGRHIFLAMAVGTLYVNLDKVVITFFWAPENTGRYFGAQRFSDLIGMVPVAMYTVLFPSLSATYARGDRAEVRGALEAALRHVSMLVTPAVVFTIALAGPLLSIVLTGVFTEAVPTVRLLALFALVYALLYPYATVLHALGRPDVTAKAAIVATALNAGLNLLLVPRSILGVPLAGMAETGAALATVVAVVVQFALLRREVHRMEGKVREHHVVKHLAAGAVMLVFLTLVLPAVPALAVSATNAPLPLMLVHLALGGLVYLGVLVALREFTRRDLGLYLHVLDPKAMARYVRAEVRAHGPGHGSGEDSEQPPPGPKQG
jgi:O-antigen/teichoic acid export membrane protein